MERKMEVLGERLKALRKEKGMTQKAMAALLGVTERHYQSMEAGTVNVPSLTLLLLADHFGVSADYLLGRSEQRAKENSIILHVYYTGTPEAVRAFLEDIDREGLRETVRAEEGCLQYDYFLSCQDTDTLLLVEHWRDALALENHSAQPHMDRIRRLKASRGLSTRIERYE